MIKYNKNSILILRRNLLRRYPRLSIPLNTLACTISFGLALPMSIAIFPQKSKVNIMILYWIRFPRASFAQVATSELEKDIQAKTKLPFVYYNKGL